MEQFSRLKQKVLDQKPILREILNQYGEVKLFDYAKKYAINQHPPDKARQDEFINAFCQEVTKRLGETIADSAARQLEKYYFVSTTDHHGPICHPFFVSSNLIIASSYAEHYDPVLRNVIVLACANVSLNNSSFPRGLLFHSDIASSQLQRLSFFSAKSRRCPVYKFRSYERSDIEPKVIDLEVSQKTRDKVMSILEEVYFKPTVLEAENFSDQITKTNYLLWQKFFAPHIDTNPNLIYIEQESLVARLLIQYHIYADTILNKLLFDLSFEESLKEHFEGIAGGFSYSENRGTYLFWALPKGQKYRQQLWKNGNFLVSTDGTYKLELTPENLYQALEARELIPSLLMCFLVISFFYGLKCLGGFSQVNYLTLMKKAYVNLLTSQGLTSHVNDCAKVETRDLCGDLIIAFLLSGNKVLAPTTGMDLAIYGTKNTWAELLSVPQNISLAEALGPMMPEFYKIVYPENKRDIEPSSISPEDIIRFTKLDQKIKPCIVL